MSLDVASGINAFPEGKPSQESTRHNRIPTELDSLKLEVQSLRNALSRVDASRDAAIKRAEELHLASLRAFQETIRDCMSQLRTKGLVMGKEAAVLAEKAAQKLQGAFGEKDAEASFARASACLKWTFAEGLKATRRAQSTEDLPTPRSKTDISAMTLITTLQEEARAGKKLISMTSSKARDLLVGRWGGKNISRKVGRDVLRRAVTLCPVIQLGHVSGDLRGTLQLTVEGSELMGSEVIDRPYRYHSPRTGENRGDRSHSMLEIMTKSIGEDYAGREERYINALSNNNYKTPKGTGGGHIASL
jgi:hypothetical protein